MKFLVLAVALLGVTLPLRGQANRVSQMPCAYSGALLRSRAGDIVRFGSDEMKAKATFKADIDDSLKRVDFRETTLRDVLIGPDGFVVCVKTIVGIPGFSPRIEQALRAWRFHPFTFRGRPVGYVGRLEFSLCNVDCGASGNSMTLLK